MMAAHRNAIRSYASVGVETGVLGASPHKLILMLFEGANLSIVRARQHMRERQIAEKGRAISMAIDIIGNGLKASLDLDAGGPLAERLAALYEYMAGRLLHANLYDDEAALNEVASLLGEIKGAWEEIANDPAVLSKNQAVA
jgi:flagellar protein FliS